MILKAKVALITGGARGIGRAISERLLERGAQVCILDILKEELAQTEMELRQKFGERNIIASTADITNEEQFKATFELTLTTFGKIDILVNNASIMKEGLWEKMMDINLGGTVRGTLLALKYMDPESGGVVLNISSSSGVFPTRSLMPLIPVYTAVKAAVMAYSRCFALNKEVTSKKIRIVCLCPSPTDTNILRDLTPDTCWDLDAVRAADLGPLLKVTDVASICEQIIQDDINAGKVALIEGANKYTFV